MNLLIKKKDKSNCCTPLQCIKNYIMVSAVLGV